MCVFAYVGRGENQGREDEMERGDCRQCERCGGEGHVAMGQTALVFVCDHCE